VPVNSTEGCRYPVSLFGESEDNVDRMKISNNLRKNKLFEMLKSSEDVILLLKR
jgi:hypothetical protein